MANVTKIPGNLAAVIMLKSRSGETHGTIAEWLKTEHKITVSRMSVQRFCSKRAAEYDSKAKQIYVEAIAKTAVGDMEVLAENMAILRNARDLAVTDAKPGDIVRTCLAIKSHVELKMNLSGGNDAESIIDERDELLDMILKSDTETQKKTN